MSTPILIRNGQVCCRVSLADSKHPVQRFAKRELERVLRIAAGSRKRVPGGAEIHLSCDEGEDESFCIEQKEEHLSIHGKNPVSLLFGVYAFVERFVGARWFAPAEEIIPRHRSLRAVVEGCWEEAPAIAHRHIFPGGKNFSRRLIVLWIDWAAKNRVGEFTIDFKAWAAWRETLVPAFTKRGLSVTLCGHCISQFIPAKEFKKHPDWFAEVNGIRTPSGQYCFSSPEFIKVLGVRLSAFIRRNSGVKRISIYAQDTSVNCTCKACQRKGFLPIFSACLEAVAKTVQKKAPGVKVNFPAYNAALAWDMLEPKTAIKSKTCGVELAYWGRDYRYGMGESTQTADRRALKVIKTWRRNTAGELRILEYYTDIWMLTHLIPPLPSRIAGDCKDYVELGVDAVGPLICLPSPQVGQRRGLADRWAPLIFPNLYFFAVHAWQGGGNASAVLRDYTEKRFGRDAGLGMACITWLERNLTIITSFNQTLFRLRFVDLWQVDDKPAGGGIYFQPVDWSPDRVETAETKRRRQVCTRLVKGMARWEAAHPWDLQEKDRKVRQRTEELCSRWCQIRDRVKAIHLQLGAQADLARKRFKGAIAKLTEVLECKAGIYPGERKKCREWLTRARKMG